ncbi:PREDICTED: integrin alpha-PS4-like [Papilio xuthus]|uniref:Integrin alpha-PS4-like n=1 Tax=Papilio xuthus TaxID=66420 RepID=A0AAJ7EKF6_PAPXU|nr:PREDICTED: integrin alpha-PS4-like [Papilio xuthus]
MCVNSHCDIIFILVIKHRMHYAKWTAVFVQILIIPNFAFYHIKSMKTIVPTKNLYLSKDSYFGYSITYQPYIRSLVISAPMANFTGHIYIYDIDKDYLIKDNINVTTDDSNTHPWLGATVKTGNSFYTTCAPRPVTIMNRKLKRSGTFGQCFTKIFGVKNETIDMPQISKKDRMKDFVTFGQKMDTFGWTMDITAHDRILVGGPGMVKGRVIQYTDIRKTPQLILPENESSKHNGDMKFFNFGYGIASGKFISENISYAISTPYGNNGVGQLLFYDENGKYEGKIMDSKSRLGTLFGAVLCTVKLTSKQDSLFVGAPTYVPEDTSDDDVGAVHIYMMKNKFQLTKTIKGTHVGGRFGSAIVNLGDIDLDQRDDVAIAAPFENDGKGAVYIYTARNIFADKMSVEYTQKVHPKAVTTRSFGLSLTTMQDHDSNGCNELAIGAPETNEVFILRCFPSIHLNVYSKLPNLQIRNRTEKDQFTFKACLKAKFPKKPQQIVADILVTVNIMHPSAKFKQTKNGVITYVEKLNRNNNVYCRDIQVLTPLDKNIELYPIQIATKAELSNDPSLTEIFDANRAVVSEHSTIFALDKLRVSDCNFAYCVPNIQTITSTSFTSPYIVGSTDTESINLSMINSGETAYNACLRVRVSSARVLLAPGCTRDEHDLICEPGTPLKQNATWNIPNIMLETKFLTNRDKKINITINTYNHCENETDKITEELVIELQNDLTNLVLTSEAIPAEVVNISYINLDTEISHFYTITNKGSTNWVDMRSEIILDSKYAEIKNPIIIYTNNQNMTCNHDSKSYCDIDEIRKNQKIYIMVNLRIPPIAEEEFKNISIITRLNLIENEEIKTLSALSILVRVELPHIAFWIYLAAGIIAILVLVIIIIIFYECGFLQRKNKEKLIDLKKDVRRQSMRRTMLLRESMRSAQAREGSSAPDDQNKLLEVDNKENPTDL